MYFFKIWPYEFLLIISILGLSTFSSLCIRASYAKNSSVWLNSYSLGIVSFEDLEHKFLKQEASGFLYKFYLTFLSFAECQLRSMF